MARLSSETLFHYVREKRFLLNILKYNFRPRYVEETLFFETGELSKIAIPMLCFCDIKLSSIEEHVEWYGKYGIGMKKEWALKKGLTPVHYYNPQSHVFKELSYSLSTLRDNLNLSEDYNSAFIGNYYNLWYMKPYHGKQYNKVQNIYLDKKFYDEREWRYIPSLEMLKELGPEMPTSLVGNNLIKYNKNFRYQENINSKLGNSINLDFTPEDIAYIIVATEIERAEMIKIVKDTKVRFEDQIKEILCSKIISLEQISNDF